MVDVSYQKTSLTPNFWTKLEKNVGNPTGLIECGMRCAMNTSACNAIEWDKGNEICTLGFVSRLAE